jgi:hypothetical protein
VKFQQLKTEPDKMWEIQWHLLSCGNQNDQGKFGSIWLLFFFCDAASGFSNASKMTERHNSPRYAPNFSTLSPT